MTKDQKDKKFATLLRHQIEASSFSQSSLASSLSTSRAYVSKLTSGETSPSVERIDQIGEALNLSDDAVEKLSKAAASDLLAEKGFKFDLPDDWD